MSLLDVLNWVQNTGWATGIKESSLLFPIIEGSHIMALSFSVGMIMILDMRLLRISFRSETVSSIMEQLMPFTLAGFAIEMLTGVLLFLTQAVKAYGNPFFRIKMILLVLAGINALYYQVKYYPKDGRVGPDSHASRRSHRRSDVAGLMGWRNRLWANDGLRAVKRPRS